MLSNHLNLKLQPDMRPVSHFEGRPKKFGSFGKVATRKLAQLDAAETLGFLRSPPGNRLQLKGDRKGQLSMRINDQWRICFRWTGTGPADVEKNRLLQPRSSVHELHAPGQTTPAARRNAQLLSSQGCLSGGSSISGHCDVVADYRSVGLTLRWHPVRSRN